MEDKDLLSKDKILLRIANHLIINASFIEDLGLYHGKMGILLFFIHYSRYKGIPIYNDFAGELLNEIYEEIHMDMPIDFESGLCGIGWGIEYLIQNGFVEGDSDQILEDIDKKIMERDITRIEDQSFETGLSGISFYVEYRLKKKREDLKTIPFDVCYLNNLRRKSSLMEKRMTPENLFSEVLKKSLNANDIQAMRLGLNEGCSGIGLKMMLK